MSSDPSSISPLHLPSSPDAAGQARMFVRRVCGERGLDGASETASLIVTELVANSLRHAHSDVVVTLDVRPQLLTVEVRDRSTVAPRMRSAGLWDETGRGLLMVDALAANWGVDVVGDGKRVWADIAL